VGLKSLKSLNLTNVYPNNNNKNNNNNNNKKNNKVKSKPLELRSRVKIHENFTDLQTCRMKTWLFTHPIDTLLISNWPKKFNGLQNSID
jgi:hypothetical protein